MPGENQNGMQCAEFDALLSDALDGTLQGPKLESLATHAASCAVCGPLMAEAEAGRSWLKSLEPVEPPADMVRNIMIATTGLRPSWWERFHAAVIAPVAHLARQPRFAMSFGMAFFSLSVTLSMAGVRLSDLSHIDLRPGAVKRTYYQTTAKVVKYYENIRWVYELETRVREFKQATTPAATEPEQENNKKPKDNTSEKPDRNERNYSQGENQPVLALAPNSPPVVPVTTYRRLV